MSGVISGLLGLASFNRAPDDRVSSSKSLLRGLLLLDLALCCAVVYLVPYTEIDWIAYMQEVEGYLAGERDYTKLKGDTGPLVYPAGFVYLYSLLYYVTDKGKNILVAQGIFVGVYLAVAWVAMQIYRLARVPPYLMVILVLSKRIHSIFVLRCFNDCFAMLFAYLAIWMFMRNRWRVGCILFSLGVSIKMNVFLFAPGLLYVMLRKFSLPRVVSLLAFCAWVQLTLGAPFLATYPVEYLTKAFELSRVFTYKWTVNFRFLPEHVFVSKGLGLALLGCTLGTWAMLFLRRWAARSYRNGDAPLSVDADVAEDSEMPGQIAATLFESSLAGIVFSRTLHYQFYVWFFHQLPFVLYFSCWHGGAHRGSWSIWHVWKLAVLAGIEYAFNVYPSTSQSSLVLVAALLLTQLAVLTCSDPPKSEAAALAQVAAARGGGGGGGGEAPRGLAALKLRKTRQHK